MAGAHGDQMAKSFGYTTCAVLRGSTSSPAISVTYLILQQTRKEGTAMGWGVGSAGGKTGGGKGILWSTREAWIVFLILILLLMGTWGGLGGI